MNAPGIKEPTEAIARDRAGDAEAWGELYREHACPLVVLIVDLAGDFGEPLLRNRHPRPASVPHLLAEDHFDLGEAGVDVGRAGRRDGLEHDLEVEPERPLIDVGQVQLHPGLEIDLVASADLPDAGDPRLHREPAPLPALVLGDLVGDGRPRTDHAHVAHQHVPELGKLVQASLAQHAAHRRDAWILLNLEGGVPAPIR